MTSIRRRPQHRTREAQVPSLVGRTGKPQVTKMPNSADQIQERRQTHPAQAWRDHCASLTNCRKASVAFTSLAAAGRSVPEGPLQQRRRRRVWRASSAANQSRHARIRSRTCPIHAQRTNPHARSTMAKRINSVGQTPTPSPSASGSPPGWRLRYQNQPAGCEQAGHDKERIADLEPHEPRLRMLDCFLHGGGRRGLEIGRQQWLPFALSPKQPYDEGAKDQH